ncbi:MAG: hypothetical protein AUJ98_08710 [Bacteroidetes bacterium CG2_30_33_31]|nr:MAG: hypothetical protein AUJ98_08710 [Bacteroidetes bacterium CG2_30_33_31]
MAKTKIKREDIHDIKDSKELIFPKNYGEGTSFVVGDDDENRLIVKYFLRNIDKKFIAKVYFGAKTQGPASHVHGGAMAAVLDEAMGLAAWAAGFSVVAKTISVDYISLLPLHTLATVETNVEKVDGRKIFMSAKLIDELGKVYCSSTGLYITLPLGTFSADGFHEELLKQVL